MQPVAAQPQAMIPPQPVLRAVTIEDFINNKPTKFTRKSTPDEVNVWLQEYKKIFRVITCIEDQQLTFVIFLLVGDVEY